MVELVLSPCDDLRGLALTRPAVAPTPSFWRTAMQTLRSFIRNEDGATMVEYGLMLALIAIVCILAVTAIGTNANVVFQNSADALAATAP
jgi:pilus assembly protein Flp/PilA